MIENNYTLMERYMKAVREFVENENEETSKIKEEIELKILHRMQTCNYLFKE